MQDLEGGVAPEDGDAEVEDRPAGLVPVEERVDPGVLRAAVGREPQVPRPHPEEIEQRVAPAFYLCIKGKK